MLDFWETILDLATSWDLNDRDETFTLADAEAFFQNEEIELIFPDPPREMVIWGYDM